MKKKCELCGGEAYCEEETPDGKVTMCFGCHTSYESFCAITKGERGGESVY